MREKLEDMISQFIHVERQNSQRIRIVVGDGGLDTFEGELSDPAGIDVYQVKYSEFSTAISICGLAR